MLSERHYTQLFDAIADAIAVRVAERMTAQRELRLLNVDEVAKAIGRTSGAVRQLISRGEIVAVRSGRRVQIETSQLEAWIERNRTA